MKRGAEPSKSVEEEGFNTDMSTNVNDKSGQSESLDSSSKRNQSTSYIEIYRLYRQRLPFVIEHYLGINMNYYTSIQIPNNLIVNCSSSYMFVRPHLRGDWSKTMR